MFLTAEDPRALIKGSRDPLGIQPLWTSLGRYVIGNLSSQSNSVRGFTVLLLGRYFAEKFIDENDATKDDAVNIFLRMEQLGAYVRYIGHDVSGDIRGIDRVKKRVSDQKRRLPIQADREGMIMSDQKAYGLWGLFSVPARASGLLEEGPIGLTDPARKFVEENYVPRLNNDLSRLKDLLIHDGYINGAAQDTLFTNLKEILSPIFTDPERAFYGSYIRDGEHVQPIPIKQQAIVVELMLQEFSKDTPLEREQFETLRSKALSSKEDEVLHRYFDRICRAETIFAISMLVFTFLLSRDGVSMTSIADLLSDRWGTRGFNIDLGANHDLIEEVNKVYGNDREITRCFNSCQTELSNGSYLNLIEALIAWNKVIASRRGGSPWLEVGPQQTLQVKYRGPEPELPDGESIHHLWRNTYFLPSIRTVSYQLLDEGA